jgi:hypothetical protein
LRAFDGGYSSSVAAMVARCSSTAACEQLVLQSRPWTTLTLTMTQPYPLDLLGQSQPYLHPKMAHQTPKTMAA